MSGRIILDGFNPSLDGNGDPVSGAKLYFYQNNTTTLQTVFSDPALLTPLANPLSCDAAGRFVEIYAPTGQAYSIKWTRPGLSDITINDVYASVPATRSTRQVLTSGSGATYTTPANCTQLRIRLQAPGAGGSGSRSGGNGSDGSSDTIFNSYHAKLGKATVDAGTGGVGGSGGADGTGATSVLRFPGQSGQSGNTGSAIVGGSGGNSMLGFGGQGIYLGTGSAGKGYGSGGQGGSEGATSTSPGVGGGAGEGVELIINSPAATYLYTVGLKGAGGAAGSGGQIGGAGADGVIIVDEIY